VVHDQAAHRGGGHPRGVQQLRLDPGPRPQPGEPVGDPAVGTWPVEVVWARCVVVVSVVIACSLRWVADGKSVPRGIPVPDRPIDLALGGLFAPGGLGRMT
jgi:hypothetical protein